MKKFKNTLSLWLLASCVFFIVSCDNNEEIKVDPNASFDAVLEVKETGIANPNVDVAVDANTTSSIKAKVSFITITKEMLRKMSRKFKVTEIKKESDTFYQINPTKEQLMQLIKEGYFTGDELPKIK